MKVIAASVISALGVIAVHVKRRGQRRGGKRDDKEEEKDYDRKSAFVANDGEVMPIPGAEQGPLRGLKYVIKDIFDVKSRVTGFGSPAWAKTHPAAKRTADVVEALTRAGASAVGITHMDELAYAINGENEH